MSKPTAGAASSAASVLFNLPGYEVLEVTRDDDGARTVVIATAVSQAACPGCGVLSSRVHQRTRQRLVDAPFDGRIEVVWIKKRWKCAEALCAKQTFAEHTDQVPPRARLTQRLTDAILDAVASEVRAIDRVAGQFGVSWPTVQRLIEQAAAALAAWRRTRPPLVRHLGIDEHRFRSVRWFKDTSGSWRRIEPRLTPFVDLATGEVDVVDGRDGGSVAGWLAAQPRWWRPPGDGHRIDGSASFRFAVRQRAKLDHMLRTDDPTDEIGAAWGIKDATPANPDDGHRRGRARTQEEVRRVRARSPSYPKRAG